MGAFSKEQTAAAKAYFCNQCVAMGYTNAEAETILKAYLETGVAIQIGSVYALVDDRYWERTWLYTGLTFYEAITPQEALDLNSKDRL
jgi:hypothetical protein